MPKAVEVKASLDRLCDLLDGARRYSEGYQGTPIYVQRTTQHIYRKLLDLEREARHLQRRCPDKFRFE